MTPLTDTTVATLRREILSGTLPAGTKLAEAPVAKRLGVSRVPVREALVILANEGLVQFKETGRSFVKHLSHSDFEELYAMRLLLEPACARLVGAQLGPHLAALEKNIRETDSASSVSEVTSLDLDFHELLMIAAGNSRLLRCWRGLRPEMQLWLGSLHRRREVRLQDVHRETVRAHTGLLECIKNGSPAQAEALMRKHILGWKLWIAKEPSDPAPEPAETRRRKTEPAC